jgi:integrase
LRHTRSQPLSFASMARLNRARSRNPREVATKSGKSIDTFFARGFEDAEAVLRAWITHLDEVALYGPDDPLFPATDVSPQSNAGFAANGFTRRPWKSTKPVRKIVNAAFETAGLPNYGPHAFRHMLARHAVNTCTSVAEFVPTRKTSDTPTSSPPFAATAKSVENVKENWSQANRAMSEARWIW